MSLRSKHGWPTHSGSGISCRHGLFCLCACISLQPRGSRRGHGAKKCVAAEPDPASSNNNNNNNDDDDDDDNSSDLQLLFFGIHICLGCSGTHTKTLENAACLYGQPSLATLGSPTIHLGVLPASLFHGHHPWITLRHCAGRSDFFFWFVCLVHLCRAVDCRNGRKTSETFVAVWVVVSLQAQTAA